MPDFSYHRRFVPSLDFSYRCENFSFFLIFKQSRLSKVAIKVVDLRREHRARLLKRTNAKDDNESTTPKPLPPTTTPPSMTTTTTQMPYQHLQHCRRFNLSPFWLSYIIFDAVFVCRRRILTTVRKVRGWYEKSMVQKVWFPTVVQSAVLRLHVIRPSVTLVNQDHTVGNLGK